MEKVKLNNQIVSMRKYVKQAKVHVINKLVKQIKLLQNRKGTAIQIQKAKRKAERFLEAVTLVKKIKPDDVSKLALLKSKDWKSILQDKNSSVHDRCIAMLANYGAVQKEVVAFYSLNKELVLKISDYIAEWEEKNKLPKDSPKTNKMPFMNKSDENILQVNLKDESSAGNEKNEFKTGIITKHDADESNTVFETSKNGKKVNLKVENLDINVDEVEKVAVVQKSSNDRKLTRATERDENSSISNEFNNSDEEKESNENDTEEVNRSCQNNDKNEAEDFSDEDSNTEKTCISISKSDSPLKIVKNKSKTITLLNLNELEGLDEIPVDSSFKNDESDEKESSEDETSETLQNKNTDPFFLGHNKEDFNPKELDDFSKDSDGDVRTNDSAHPFKHKTQTAKNSFFYQKDDQINPKKRFQKSAYNHTNSSKRFKNDAGNSFQRDKFAPRDFYNKLQEKNTNKNRNDFKSKSKPFPSQDTYNKKQFKNTLKGYGNKDDSSLKNKVLYKKGNSGEILHPSWEAKRKQKEMLNTSFQGKRIVFDD